MFISVLLWSGIYSGSCTGTQRRMFPPAVLAWEAFRKVTLIAPRVASEASKVKGEELDIRKRYYQVYPWYIPNPISVVEPRGSRTALRR